MDPERLVQCPYDKNHQIRACRFPYHLVKCRENNKKIAQELATCPYNARHRVLKHKLKLHISTCPDNSEPELFSVTWMPVGPRKEEKDLQSSWQCPPCEEDWEADAEEPAATSAFVCGFNAICNLNANQSLGEAGRGRNQQMQNETRTAASWAPKDHFWRTGYQ